MSIIGKIWFNAFFTTTLSLSLSPSLSLLPLSPLSTVGFIQVGITVLANLTLQHMLSEPPRRFFSLDDVSLSQLYWCAYWYCVGVRGQASQRL